MQKLSACRNADWSIHRRRSTNSSCRMAICAAGPPNEIRPIFAARARIAPNLGEDGETGL